VIGWIHHATLRVDHVEEAAARWSLLHGLTRTEHDGDAALLRCAYEDFCLELRPCAGGEVPGIEHVGWELLPGVSLADAEHRLRQVGAEPRRVGVPLRGEGLRLEDCDGNGVLVIERRGRTDQERWPAVARFSDELPAYHPRKLGHVNYLTSDAPRIEQWYVSTLGFTTTDWIGDGAVWLHVNKDHHALAFLDKGFAHIHHLAFELVDWGELRVALDHLGQHRYPVTWGPGRHAMAQNLFAYIRMPQEELFVELFADLEQLESDHVVRHFPDDPHGSNVWGLLPPRTYFKFDPESVRQEREQLHALGVAPAPATS
jgi:catechol 2,3-dioxygenase-like lactoylglutathione lyase family enzyme